MAKDWGEGNRTATLRPQTPRPARPLQWPSSACMLLTLSNWKLVELALELAVSWG